MKKIAITGASGFIGQELVKFLSNFDYEITAVYYKNKPKKIYSSKINYIKININRSCDFYKKLNEPDVLIHLAWSDLSNYNSINHTNVIAPLHEKFLKNMIKNGLKNLFCMGTCFEYGKVNGALEETFESFPNNNYAKSKLNLYKSILKIKKKNKFNLVWGRLFYIYGKNQHNTIYSQLIDSIKKNKKEFKMSEGLQVRDYLSINQVVYYIYLLSLNNLDIGIVNICSGRGIVLKKIVENWIKKLNSNIKLQTGFYPYSDLEAMSFWGSDIKLLKFTNK